MDPGAFSNLFRFRSGVSRRIREIPTTIKNAVGAHCQAERIWSTYRKCFGVASFLLSIFLGMVANSYSEQEALKRWEKNHVPSYSVVQFAMGSRGLMLNQNLSITQKLMRSLPTNLDDPGSFWMSQDSSWFAYYGNSNQQAQVQFYRMGSSSLPHHWIPMGVGWRALEKSIDAVDRVKLSNQSRKIHPAQRAKQRLDPRQLVY